MALMIGNRGAKILKKIRKIISALPWTPQWLLATETGVETYASSENILRKFNSEFCEGDPFLGSVGRTSYRSRAQRAAVRNVLSMPPGDSIIVALATGEGKSLIFQLIQKIGFLTCNHEGEGVTIVIVPTVALAINHEQEALHTCNLKRPLAYQGGELESNLQISDRIKGPDRGVFLFFHQKLRVTALEILYAKLHQTVT